MKSELRRKVLSEKNYFLTFKKTLSHLISGCCHGNVCQSINLKISSKDAKYIRLKSHKISTNLLQPFWYSIQKTSGKGWAAAPPPPPPF